jgi:hypothetical protein
MSLKGCVTKRAFGSGKSSGKTSEGVSIAPKME